jgi:hypothetical protein
MRRCGEGLMPYVALLDGTIAHVKMAKPRRRRCNAVGEHGIRCSRNGTLQCDYQVAVGRTCDAYICGQHTTSVGPDVDHCPKHATRQAGLFTGLVQP